MSKPFLSLVGAGPGDADLITLKAVKVIASADVILYDALVNEEILDYAAATAVKRFVGKRYGCHSLSQQEINVLIIEYARSHGHVVRLKGGDPFIYGRAQEEILAARRKARNISKTLFSLSVFAKFSRSGTSAKRGCRSPLGISMLA